MLYQFGSNQERGKKKHSNLNREEFNIKNYSLQHQIAMTRDSLVRCFGIYWKFWAVVESCTGRCLSGDTPLGNWGVGQGARGGCDHLALEKLHALQEPQSQHT